MKKNLLSIEGVSSIILEILYERGIKSEDEVQKFLNPDVSMLSNPFQICGMQQACELIEDTIRARKKIFIYSDGDVDGIAGAAIIANVFNSMNVAFDVKLTHRLENYEIEPEFVKKIEEMGYGLLITIDTGTTSKELIDYCEKTKFPLIIIDHHRGSIEKDLHYTTIVNPSLNRGDGDFDIFTASGLVLKLAQSFLEVFPFFPRDIFYSCIELGAIGTLNDHGLLRGENRAIVKIGLNRFENTGIPGIEKFKEHFYIPKNSDEIRIITHYLNPKLNTPGRFGKPELAFKILTAGLDENIEPIFEEIKTFEKEKQRVMRNLLSVIKSKDTERLPIFLFENIPASFSGTFAAKISEKFQMPALVAIRHGDLIQGSARSFNRINLYDFFNQIRDIFISFGGHRDAIGFKMKSSNMSELKKFWREMKIEKPRISNEIKPIHMDFENITIPFLKDLQLLKPFGYGNPPVFFTTSGVECVKITRYQKNETVVWVKQNNCLFEAHFTGTFKMPSKPLSICYSPVLHKSGDLFITWLDVIQAG